MCLSQHKRADSVQIAFMCDLMHNCRGTVRVSAGLGSIRRLSDGGEIMAPSHREPFICHLVHGDRLEHERLSLRGFHKPAAV